MGPDIRVALLMVVQVLGTHKSLPASFTSVWLDAQMFDLVFLHINQEFKGLLTNIAAVRSFASVGPRVGAETTRGAKARPAHFTCVWFLLCMTSKVIL